MHKNILTVVGITILFLGIAIQPSIAVNPIFSDNKEDCDICPEVSKIHLVRLKSLINRVERLNNKLSVISKHNTEFAEKYRELSNRFITLKEMNRKINPITPREDNQTICKILWIVLGVFVGPMITLDKILTSFEGSKLWNILEPIFYLSITVLTVLCDNILNMIYEFDCV